MPGQDYLINFRKGDPYIKVDEGFARLPVAGYEAIHPELEGIDPEDYPDIAKMRILADVAPYSREYQKFASVVQRQTRDNPELRAEYETIAEQVRKTKDSTLQVAQRHFNAPVDKLEGTVKSASSRGIELAEYPGRVFHFSAVGSSMADLTRSLPRGHKQNILARAGRQARPARLCFEILLSLRFLPAPRHSPGHPCLASTPGSKPGPTRSASTAGRPVARCWRLSHSLGKLNPSPATPSPQRSSWIGY